MINNEGGIAVFVTKNSLLESEQVDAAFADIADELRPNAEAAVTFLRELIAKKNTEITRLKKYRGNARKSARALHAAYTLRCHELEKALGHEREAELTLSLVTSPPNNEAA